MRTCLNFFSGSTPDLKLLYLLLSPLMHSKFQKHWILPYMFIHLERLWMICNSWCYRDTMILGPIPIRWFLTCIIYDIYPAVCNLTHLTERHMNNTAMKEDSEELGRYGYVGNTAGTTIRKIRARFHATLLLLGKALALPEWAPRLIW